MATQLRPLSLGEVLDRTAELYRTNFPLFAGIAAIFSGALLLAGFLQLGAQELLGYPNIAPGHEWAVAVITVAGVLVALLLAGLSIDRKSVV